LIPEPESGTESVPELKQRLTPSKSTTWRKPHRRHVSFREWNRAFEKPVFPQKDEQLLT
jgi:hypothetical protein